MDSPIEGAVRSDGEGPILPSFDVGTAAAMCSLALCRAFPWQTTRARDAAPPLPLVITDVLVANTGVSLTSLESHFPLMNFQDNIW